MAISYPITLVHNASTDPTTDNYKLYVGRLSGLYLVAGSPFTTGNTLSYQYTITETGDWFFAFTAVAGASEGAFSSEFKVKVAQPAVARRGT